MTYCHMAVFVNMPFSEEDNILNKKLYWVKGLQRSCRKNFDLRDGMSKVTRSYDFHDIT